MRRRKVAVIALRAPHISVPAKILVCGALVASFSACSGNRSDSPDLGVGFRPVQLHWSAAEGVDPDAEMPGKDECVIRVTAAVMAAPEVHASKVAELEYSATFGRMVRFQGKLPEHGGQGGARMSLDSRVWS